MLFLIEVSPWVFIGKTSDQSQQRIVFFPFKWNSLSNCFTTGGKKYTNYKFYNEDSISYNIIVDDVYAYIVFKFHIIECLAK